MIIIGTVFLLLLFGIIANISGLKSASAHMRRLSTIAIILFSATFLGLAGYLYYFIANFTKIGG